MTALPPLVCGGCRTCCLGDTIALLPTDDASQYKTKLVDGRRVLAKGKDGNCIYLGKSGCQIYGRQPHQCRIMDCRMYAAKVLTMPPQEQAWRNAHPQIGPTLLEGRKRLAEPGPQ